MEEAHAKTQASLYMHLYACLIRTKIALADRLFEFESDFRKVSWPKNKINPFMPNGTSHPYQLDQSISILRIVGCYFSFYSNPYKTFCM